MDEADKLALAEVGVRSAVAAATEEKEMEVVEI